MATQHERLFEREQPRLPGFEIRSALVPDTTQDVQLGSIAPIDVLEDRLASYESEHAEIPGKGIRVSINHFEVALPHIYAKLGFDIDAPQVTADLAISRQSTAMGDRITQAYTLFSVVHQMRHGATVDDVLRFGDESVKNPYRLATAHLKFPKKITVQGLEDLFTAAWEKFPYAKPEGGEQNMVLFPNMGFYDPLPARHARAREDRIIDSGSLAYMCAQARMNTALDSWEFRPDVATLSRVPIVINTGKGIQITTVVDSLSVKKYVGVGMPAVQFRDMQLGSIDGLQGVAAEVRMRQMQTTHRIAEYLTGMLERKDLLLRRNSALIANNVSLTARVFEHAAELGVVLFSPRGEMQCIMEESLDEERAAFNRWLTWYCKAVNVFSETLRPMFSDVRSQYHW